MSMQLLAKVLAPLLGLFILSVGNGFLSSLTTLRLDASGASATMVGIVSSAYFIGLTIGALFHDRLIVRIGHIRAYSSFASLGVVSILMQALSADWTVWILARLVYGWTTVGIFLVIESWLLLAADQSVRGRLLALYMISFYGAGALSQVLLGSVAGLGETAPFITAAMLASLSVLPIVILPRITPTVERVEALKPSRLFQMSPSGVIGCFGSGVAIAAIYSLLPLYLQHAGLQVEEVGHMMASVILGAMVLQYPVGRWSDRQDRRIVLITLAFICLLLCAAILLLPHTSTTLMITMFLFGGGVFAIYPVSVSFAADRASSESLVPIIQGLLLINSLGSAISPIAISPVMNHFGASGLFWSLAVLNVGLISFFFWRRGVRPESNHVAPFAATTAMTPVGAELRVTDEMIQGVHDNET
ncbi:MFS transporter [Rhizobium sp. CG4]|jgi:MFS family permease|uniref:MFS transporter n=1 Tax=Rhizobium/Agrobacterium group TaxID=227290 RepID=UPI00203467AE|nr:MULTISPECIES: MFS transporter [Rhizobium/Agrobacterium group]MCM2457840.1 MFS transporter [Rhizobium sp. CG4]MCS4243315.1 MFS family permease [Rhizobium sp. BIGb0125]MDO5897699.1 MFS transporter [Agrobacterium sp. Azo12]